jgi:hypothetical protein
MLNRIEAHGPSRCKRIIKFAISGWQVAALTAEMRSTLSHDHRGIDCGEEVQIDDCWDINRDIGIDRGEEVHDY